MSLKTKKMIIIFIIYYGFLFTAKSTIFNKIMLGPSDFQLSENCIIVEGQVITGPEFRVVKGAEFLANMIPTPHPENLNLNEIELTGKSIYNDIFVYPEYYQYDWVIYGKVIGTTDMYEECGSGTIPIFECTKLFPVITLSEFLKLEILLFAIPPFGFLLALLIYLCPIIIIPLVLKKISK